MPARPHPFIVPVALAAPGHGQSPPDDAVDPDRVEVIGTRESGYRRTTAILRVRFGWPGR